MDDLIEVRQSPVSRRIVGQAAHMGIVAAVIGCSLFGDLRCPRLIRQAAREIHSEIARER